MSKSRKKSNQQWERANQSLQILNEVNWTNVASFLGLPRRHQLGVACKQTKHCADVIQDIRRDNRKKNDEAEIWYQIARNAAIVYFWRREVDERIAADVASHDLSSEDSDAQGFFVWAARRKQYKHKKDREGKKPRRWAIFGSAMQALHAQRLNKIGKLEECVP